jgi:flavin reductase (DIM6/NTAB) family NADH-FMN oxidoreductase RutF
LTNGTAKRRRTEELHHAFLEAFGRLPSGIVMVTTEVDGRPWAVTISSCTSISAHPPTLMVSLRSESVAAQAIRGRSAFGVSILGRAGLPAARAGALPGTPKFAEEHLSSDPRCTALETAAICGALAHLDCDVVKATQVADHDLVFGQVSNVLLFGSNEPLVHHGRRFHSLGATTCLDEPIPLGVFLDLLQYTN